MTERGGWNKIALCAGIVTAAVAATMTAATLGKTSDHEVKEKRKTKRIGILCGSGPEAGMDSFAKILSLHRKIIGKKYRTDKDAPDVLLSSVSSIGGPRTKNDLIRGTEDCQKTWESLKMAIEELAPLVDCFCISCHQLHFFEADIRALLKNLGEPPSKFVSMCSITMEHCQTQQQLKSLELISSSETIDNNKLAILGGPITTDLTGRSPYKALADAIPGTLHLTHEERQGLLDIIKAVKEKGPLPDIAHKFETILRDLSKQGVGVAVLACTEFPLLPVQNICHEKGRLPPAVKLIDPTELVAMEMLHRTQQY